MLNNSFSHALSASLRNGAGTFGPHDGKASPKHNTKLKKNGHEKLQYKTICLEMKQSTTLSSLRAKQEHLAEHTALSYNDNVSALSNFDHDCKKHCRDMSLFLFVSVLPSLWQERGAINDVMILDWNAETIYSPLYGIDRTAFIQCFSNPLSTQAVS